METIKRATILAQELGNIVDNIQGKLGAFLIHMNNRVHLWNWQRRKVIIGTFINCPKLTYKRREPELKSSFHGYSFC